MGSPQPEPANTSLLGLNPQGLLQAVLDHVGVGLAVIDQQHKFVFVNQTARDMFGAMENLTLAAWRRTIRSVHDSQGREIPPLESPLMHALNGDEVEPQEVRLTFRDGRRRWFHAAAHPFSVLGLSGVLAVVTDETEQVELRKTMERVQRAEEIGVLAGGLAHDFNNILSALSENVALALSDEGVPPITCSRLEQMRDALTRGADLTKRLMRYRRAEDTPMRPLDINDVANSALELVRPLFKGVRTEIKMSGNLPALEGDFSRLEQVIVNLILNSLDAMPQGGELSIHTELVSGELKPHIPSEAKGQFVVITVADTGTGIPKHIQPNIFAPFFTTKPSGRGTGLGLAIAETVVRQHNGHITFESTPGSGTRFSIYLPVPEQSSEISEAAS